ncbi:hypothetical protein BAE44_0015206, partial [Dichanthelium oligosanthes]
LEEFDLEGHIFFSSVHDAVCAEAEACRAALQSASRHGITHCRIETDLTILVTALKSCSYDQATEGVLFKELRDLIRLEFIKVEIMFSPRSCNMCAHDLAHVGLSRDPNQSVVWTDPLLEFVNVPVSRELTRPNGR